MSETTQAAMGAAWLCSAVLLAFERLRTYRRKGGRADARKGQPKRDNDMAMIWSLPLWALTVESSWQAVHMAAGKSKLTIGDLLLGLLVCRRVRAAYPERNPHEVAEETVKAWRARGWMGGRKVLGTRLFGTRVRRCRLFARMTNKPELKTRKQEA